MTKKRDLDCQSRRRRRDWRRRTLVLAALERGCRFGYPLSRLTGIRSGRLYAVLDHLEREGLIRGEFVEDGTSPARRAYTLTGGLT